MSRNRIEKYIKPEEGPENRDAQAGGKIVYVPLNCMVLPIIIPAAIIIVEEGDHGQGQ